jgi:chromosome segregation ATPase
MIYTDDNGNKVEVFTAEELESKVEEARLQAYEEALEMDADSELKTKYEEAQRELSEIKEKRKDMSGNLSGQREVIKNKEAEVNLLKTKVEELANSQQKILSEFKGTTVNSKIENLTSDKEVIEKVKHYYNNFFADKVKEDKDVDVYIKDAYTLATGSKPTVGAEVYSSSGGEAPSITPKADNKLSADGIELAKKLNIYNEEKFKKAKLI